jgi:Protein of unknown function (DUF2889)
MPLSPPQPRQPLVKRTISCQGYARDDGLLDIEGQLVDTYDYEVQSPERGRIEAQTPIHEMHLRLTIDDGSVIRALESAIEHSPFKYCQGVIPNLQRLVGVKVTGGFRKIVQEQVGHTEGCTHIVTLLNTLSTVAIRTLAGSRRVAGKGGYLDAFATRGDGRHPLLNTCRTYAADSPITLQLAEQIGLHPPESPGA